MCRHSFFFAFPVYYSPWVLPTLQGFLSFLNSFVTCFHIRHRTNKNSVLAALKRVGFPEVSCKRNVKAFFLCGIQKYYETKKEPFGKFAKALLSPDKL